MFLKSFIPSVDYELQICVLTDGASASITHSQNTIIIWLRSLRSTTEVYRHLTFYLVSKKYIS